VLALSLLLLPLTAPTFAQTMDTTPETQHMETRAEDGGHTGLWGLLGLAGLFGLLGLQRRRPAAKMGVYDRH